MAIQNVNVGAAANDHTGDPLRTAFQKVNSNFTQTELFANKDTDGTLAANSDTKFPSQKAVKTFASNAANLSSGVLPSARVETALNNVALGSSVLGAITTGYINVGIGSSPLGSLTDGFSMIGIGWGALGQAVHGNACVSIGALSSQWHVSPVNNIAIGAESQVGNIPGNQIVNGSFANGASWTLGAGWVVGSAVASHTSDGTATLATAAYIDFGVGGTYRITYTVSGYSVGSVTASFGGASDVARSANGTYIWDCVPTSYPSGSSLVFTPSNTARLSITGVSLVNTDSITARGVVAVGVGTAYMNVAGDNLVAIGTGALRQHVTGDNNVAVGVEALLQNGSGQNNTAIGRLAGYSGFTNSGGVFLGFCAGFKETASNKFIIDNKQPATEAAGRANALIYGVFGTDASDQTLSFAAKVGIGAIAPTSALQVVGIPVYANNAAAITGGLTAGAFYRTGADPDPLMIVH